MGEQQVVRVGKTCKYTRTSTVEQEPAREVVVRGCRERSNAAREERRDAWQPCGVSVTVGGHSAQLPAVKEVGPDDRDLHAQDVQDVQDVLSRRDRVLHACLRRVTNGEPPGDPRVPGAARSTSVAYTQLGTGATLATLATLATGLVVRAQMGGMAVRWSRPLEGTPKTVSGSRAADGWYAGCSCEGVPSQPLPRTGQQTGVARGGDSFATLADGRQIAPPRMLRLAERRLKRAHRRGSRRTKGSHRRRTAVQRWAQAHLRGKRHRHDFHHTGGAPTRPPHRHDLSRRRAAGQPGRDPPPRHVDCGRRVEGLLAHPQRHSSIRWAPSRRGAACLPQPDLLWLRRHRPQGPLCVRWHACPDCGTSLQRDHNAATNRESLGHRLRAAVASAAAENTASPGLSHGSVKEVMTDLALPARR